MRILASLLKASLVAAVVFDLAWIRIPGIISSLERIAGFAIGYGFLIVVLSVVIGFPIAYVLEKCRLMRWQVSTMVGAAVGALLGGIFTYHGESHEPVQVENPHGGPLTFSPWNRDAPGFIDRMHWSQADFVGSIAFGAIVGGVLGLAFWYFYSRASRDPKQLGR